VRDVFDYHDLGTEAPVRPPRIKLAWPVVRTSPCATDSGWQAQVSPPKCNGVGYQHQRQLLTWPRKWKPPSNWAVREELADGEARRHDRIKPPQ